MEYKSIIGASEMLVTIYQIPSIEYPEDGGNMFL
jgi:hypothetical protein